jgi:hypothetical protein
VLAFAVCCVVTLRLVLEFRGAVKDSVFSSKRAPPPMNGVTSTAPASGREQVRTTRLVGIAAVDERPAAHSEEQSVALVLRCAQEILAKAVLAMVRRERVRDRVTASFGGGLPA